LPLPTIPSGNVFSSLPTGYDVANSCRFNTPDSSYVHKTQGTSTDTDKYTLSVWLKRGSNLGAVNSWFAEGTGLTAQADYNFSANGTMMLYNRDASSNIFQLVTNRVFRDVSAWYHIVLLFDSSQGVAANRMKLYINGVQETSFSTATYPAQDLNSEVNQGGTKHTWAAFDSNGSIVNEFDGYVAEALFLDGTVAAIGDLGEFDEDSPTIWKPKDVSGLTFGTNGYYLDFEDSANLGNDANGGTDFTEVNLAAADQATDTPTNNFCTLNPLDMYYINSSTLSEGNCKWTGSTQYGFGRATVALTSGKWYFEVKMTNYDSADSSIGITGAASASSTNWLGNGTHQYGYLASNGSIYHGNSGTSHGDTYGEGNIIGCYFDLDNNKLYFSKDGVLQNSGTGHSITAAASTTDGAYTPAFGDSNTSAGHVIQDFNFGGCPAFAISSGNTDGEYGNFEYSTTITGDGSSKTFKAICTKNIAEFG